MAVTNVSSITLSELQQQLTAVNPAVVLLRKRILRRVMWEVVPLELRGYSLFHRQHFLIGRDTLLKIVDKDEIHTSDANALPEQLILLAQPTESELDSQPAAEVLLQYWRLLFYASVEAALREKLGDGNSAEISIQERIERIGRTAFAEIKTVLLQELALISASDLVDAYIQFVAKYLELRFFAPRLLPIFFPAAAKRIDVDHLIGDDIDGERFFLRTRLHGGLDPLESVEPETAAAESPPEHKVTRTVEQVHRGIQRATKAIEHGNTVRATIIQTKLAGSAPGEAAKEAEHKANKYFQELIDRLHGALRFSETAKEEWKAALLPLLKPAAKGFWPPAARLLYDLQKVCVDRERGLYKVSLLKWIFSFGKTPLKRKVPALQEVLMLKHLRSAYHRLRAIDLPFPDHERLAALLQEVIHQEEERVRHHFRPVLIQCLNNIELVPENLPERIARDKLCEELLDRIVEHGVLLMSDLRDAISRNQLKLDNVPDPLEFFQGDKLLALNSELADKLDDVYRQGEFYLRWMQSVSSLAFGTRLGRFLTKYLVVPFGGAFVALKGTFFLYMEALHLLPGHSHSPGHDGETEMAQDPLTTPWSVGLLGLFVLLMLHVPAFRRRVFEGLRIVGKSLHWLFIGVPSWLLRQPVVRGVLDSAIFRFVKRYLFKPVLLASLVMTVSYSLRFDVGMVRVIGAGVFAVTCLFFSTRAGRMADEILSHWLVEGLHRFSFQWVPALLRAIWDTFKWLVGASERLLYGIDEWFRFRSSQSNMTMVVKSVFGVFWFFISYAARLLIVLFIEPSINPIKHFPVVTVAGKFMAPLVFVLPPVFEPRMGSLAAGVLTSIIVIGGPGIFGFLVWELKENWKLYKANRPRNLKPVLVGHHGETVVRLLKPGFHSGTIPNTYAKWRRAEQRDKRRAIFKSEDRLVHVEESMRHFVDRELISLIHQSRVGSQWNLSSGKIRLCVTHISVELHCSQFPEDPLLIGFDLKSRWLLAKIIEPGWLEQMPDTDRNAIRFALMGLYKRSGVAMLEEDLQKVLARFEPAYDITKGKLVVWPGKDFQTKVQYDLEQNHRLEAELISGAASNGWPELDASELFFSSKPIAWEDWLDYWENRAAAGVKEHESVTELVAKRISG